MCPILQPYGQGSKQHLADLVFGKDAKADGYNINRYDRDVCTVFVNGQDDGLAQLDAGRAWWFRKYAHEQLPRIASTTSQQRTGRQQIELGYGRIRTPCRRGSGVMNIAEL